MLYLGIVVFNSCVENSIILKQNITSNKDVRVIVFDNSTDRNLQNVNRNFIRDKSDLLYMTNGGNIGLSCAYNKMLDYIKNQDIVNTDNDYVMWIDDDTDVSSDLIEQVRTGINQGYDIILPKIEGQDGIIYSPNERGRIRNNLVLNRGNKIDLSKINGINSCLTVKLSIFNDFEYDESLFLDQVDQFFFDKMRKRNLRYLIIEHVVKQNFSQRNTIRKQEYLSRFAIRKKDILQYGKISPDSNIFYCRVKVLLLGIQFAFKSGSIKYLLEAIK